MPSSFEHQQDVLPIQQQQQQQHPMQPLKISRRRASRAALLRSDATATVTASDHSHNEIESDTIPMGVINNPGKSSGPSAAATVVVDSVSYAIHPSSSSSSSGPGMVQDGLSEKAYTSPLTWLSRVITKAGQDERLHYHTNGHHHHHHHHHHHQSHSHHQGLVNDHGINASLQKQLFSKASVVTLEKKYATVHWAAEFYCTISSPCFALPVLLYLDPTFRWSAPDIHVTHFAIFLSVLTALTSTLYHATLYKIFSSLDACFATIMFYMNTIQLLRSLPDHHPYAPMIPTPISIIVHWEGTPYLLALTMITLFTFSWKRTTMLSLMLMILMIPASIWGFVVHEAWIGLAFGILGISMFAVDRFKLFCGHSYWHLAGGLSLWYGIASGALAK